MNKYRTYSYLCDSGLTIKKVYLCCQERQPPGQKKTLYNVNFTTGKTFS